MKTKPTVAAPILLTAVFLLCAMIRLIPQNAFGEGNNPYVSVSLLQLAVFAVPSLIFMKLRSDGYTKKLRLRLPKQRHVLFTVSAAVVMILSSVLLNYLMLSLFPDSYTSSAQSYMSASSGSVLGGVHAIVAFAILPALCEEFLFRGIIIAEYESVGVAAAVLFSSLTFAMSHFSFVRLPVYLFAGLCLALILYVTKSLFAAMIVHAAFNTFSMLGEELCYRIIHRQGAVMFIFALSVLLAVFLIICLGQAERIYSYYGATDADSSYRTEKKKRLSPVAAVLSPPFLALCALYIIMGAIS